MYSGPSSAGHDVRASMKAQTTRRTVRRTAPYLAIAIVASALLAVVATNLSPVVEDDLPPVSPAISLSVSGIPADAHAGDVFRVAATLGNNANRPLPAVLRMEIRNVNTTLAGTDITVYAGCGAEESLSTRTLRYYLGSHGPLLAPNGSWFPSGSTVAVVETGLGVGGHWEVVLREIETRDPLGYASLISPGPNASAGPRASTSLALKALYYFGMVSSTTPGSGDPADWRLTVPFEDRWSPTDNLAPGFLVEIAPTVRGGFALKLWAELPDGLGVPNHPTWTCGPL